jgi:hypothetical protein
MTFPDTPYPYPQGTLTEGRLSTVDLRINVACFVVKVNNIFNIKSSRSKLVSTRRSNVPNLPLR